MNTLSDAGKNFENSLREFLGALEGTWPECQAVREASLGVEALFDACFTDAAAEAKRLEIIGKFVEVAKPHYAMILARDPNVFRKDLGVINDVKMSEKYADPSIDDGTREAIWHYVWELCRHAQAADVIQTLPDGVTRAVLGNGGGEVDVMQIVEAIQGLSPAETERFQSGFNPQNLCFLLPAGVMQAIGADP